MSNWNAIVADLTFQQRALALFLIINGPQTLKALAPRFSRHRTTVMRWIKPMIERGVVDETYVEGSKAIYYEWNEVLEEEAEP